VIGVTVNGEARAVAEGATVAWLVDDLGSGRRGVAVAVNAEVISRSAWDTTLLAPEDRVEVLRAIQGGC
jgi:sulfur carrier protein